MGLATRRCSAGYAFESDTFIPDDSNDVVLLKGENVQQDLSIGMLLKYWTIG